MKTTLLVSVLAVACSTAFAQITTVVTPSSSAPTNYNYGQGIPLGATIPRIVSSVPANGQKNVNRSVRQIKITFDQPMDTATFFLPISGQGDDYPVITADPYWIDNNRTLIIPVSFSTDRLYRIPINVSNRVFRSAQGVYAESGYISFTTGGSVEKTRVSSDRLRATPPQPSSVSNGMPSGNINTRDAMPFDRTNSTQGRIIPGGNTNSNTTFNTGVPATGTIQPSALPAKVTPRTLKRNSSSNPGLRSPFPARQTP